MSKKLTVPSVTVKALRADENLARNFFAFSKKVAEMESFIKDELKKAYKSGNPIKQEGVKVSSYETRSLDNDVSRKKLYKKYGKLAFEPRRRLLPLGQLEKLFGKDVLNHIEVVVKTNYKVVKV